ncbi:MAG: SdrD B-like domain-containing protein, partial [Chitinophagaceae bacterium]
TWTGPYGLQWYPWSNNTTTTVGTGTNRTYPTPVLANIEFDDRGDMIMSFFDRGGHQWSEDNYQDLAVSTTLMRYAVGGDVLIAGSNCNGTFSIENNGAYTSANGSSYNSGAVNNQGPGTSEFFKGDNFGTTHSETSIGGLGFLPGSGELFFGTMDPLAINSGGVKRLSMATGLEIAGSGYQLAGGSIAGFGKAISLGDIEFFGTEPPIELGNRIWNDANGDGIQEPGEAGIGGVILELVDGSGNAVDSDPVTAGVQATFVTTDANGNWYLTSATGTDVTGINYGVALLPNTNYFLRLATSGTGNDWDPTANSGAGGPRAGGDLVNYQLTITDKVGTGAVDLSDNDGAMISSIPQVSITTGDYGQNNHNIDFGFKQLASLGDRVWRDDDKDGIQDTGEPGVAGVTVTLYQNGSDGLPGTLDDVLVGTTITDAYGIYLFDNLAASTNAATSYNVGFTLPANYQFTTQTNTQVTGTSNATNTTTTSGGSTAANGSDASTTTGRTGSFWLAAGEAERGTDAGLIFSQPTTNSLGDKVWFDTDGDGVQDANEAGVSGVTVTLYASDGITVIATTITDAYGNYIFTGLPANTNYIVGITPPTGMLLTTSVGGTTPGNTTTNSDFNTGTYKTAVVNTGVAGTQITGIDAGLIQQTSTRASLGDKVWNDLNGNGIQEAGEPGIAGITVNLYRDSNGDGVISGSEASTPYATTVTDAFGNYIFNNLPASSGANGFYKVGFVAPSGYTLTTA